LLWDVPTGKYFRAITEHKGGGLNAGMSPTGQLMFTHSQWAEGAKFWHPHTGKLLLNMPGATVNPSSVLADGRMYTYQAEGTRVKLWLTEPSPVHRVLVRGPSRGRPVSEYRASSVHRDGRLLAVGSGEGVSLFDLVRGIDVG